MINYELTRIQRDIVESPYKVRDLGIQVVVDNNIALPGEEVQLLSQQEQTNVEEGITSILNSMITTSIDKEFGDVNPADRISIVFQQFNSRPGVPVETPGVVAIPMWMYITGAILILLIVLLIILLVRKGRSDDVISEEIEQPVFADEMEEDEELLDQPETEADRQRKQIENMAKDRPEEFAKLLRSWITDE